MKLATQTIQCFNQNIIIYPCYLSVCELNLMLVCSEMALMLLSCSECLLTPDLEEIFVNFNAVLFYFCSFHRACSIFNDWLWQSQNLCCVFAVSEQTNISVVIWIWFPSRQRLVFQFHLANTGKYVQKMASLNSDRAFKIVKGRHSIRQYNTVCQAISRFTVLYQCNISQIYWESFQEKLRHLLSVLPLTGDWWQLLAGSVRKRQVRGCIATYSAWPTAISTCGNYIHANNREGSYILTGHHVVYKLNLLVKISSDRSLC